MTLTPPPPHTHTYLPLAFAPPLLPAQRWVRKITPPPKLCCALLTLRENPYALGAVILMVAPPGPVPPLLPLNAYTRALFLCCAAATVRHLFCAAAERHKAVLAPNSASSSSRSEAETAADRLMLILPPEAKVSARAKLGMQTGKALSDAGSAARAKAKQGVGALAGTALGAGGVSALSRVPIPKGAIDAATKGFGKLAARFMGGGGGGGPA